MAKRYKPVNLPENLIKEIDFYVNRSNLHTSRAGLIKYMLVNWVQDKEKQIFKKIFTS